MSDPVLAAHTWRTNAELIADVAALGYIKPNDKVLDPTYGRGIWWRKYRPENLTTHNRELDGSDFRSMAHADNTFDVVAFDPPYVATGGRRTSGLGTLRNTDPEKGNDFQRRYGLFDCPATPAGLQELINAGMTESCRVVKPRGIVLVKCQDYISGSKLWLGSYYTLHHALGLGMRCVDRFERISAPRPQPAARQIHARRNLSTLFVFRKVAA